MGEQNKGYKKMNIVKIKDQNNEDKAHIFKFTNNASCLEYNQEICGVEYYDKDIVIEDIDSFGYKKELRDACLINQWGLAETA